MAIKWSVKKRDRNEKKKIKYSSKNWLHDRINEKNQKCKKKQREVIK